MQKILSLLLLLLLASACGTGESVSDSPPTPTEPPLIGGVDIMSPQLGSIIYAETLAANGSIEGVDAFRLTIETVDGELLFDGMIDGINSSWQREIVHGYQGEPIEAILTARSTDRRVSLVYDELAILIASMTYREEGIFGQILLPSEDQQVGGDAIQISGTASGIPDNRLSIMLRHDEGLIDKQIIPVDNPYRVDERVWSADLLTNGYQGQATVEVTYTNPITESEQILDTTSIIIGSSAG